MQKNRELGTMRIRGLIPTREVTPESPQTEKEGTMQIEQLVETEPLIVTEITALYHSMTGGHWCPVADYMAETGWIWRADEENKEMLPDM